MIERGDGVLVQTGFCKPQEERRQRLAPQPILVSNLIACNLTLELTDHSIRIDAVAPAVVEKPVCKIFIC